jgi:apolipoprotein N-acyltransferase
MPPFGLWPVLIISMPLAVWLLDGASGAGGRLARLRAAAIVGWCFGFGFFVAGLWWLGAAFLVDADEFAWALPLGVLGLPAGLAFFTAFGFALARLLWVPGPLRVLSFAIGLSVAGWLRGHILTGFPWNEFGMALGGDLRLAQAASLVGLYGLTFLAIVFAAAPATIATEKTAHGRWALPVLALLGMAGLALFGQLRLSGAQEAFVPGVKLRIMQPNLPQDAKFSPENANEIMRHYLTLSDKATSPLSTGVGDVTHLIWPESAFPFILSREPRALAQIATLLPPGTTLITGAARAGTRLPGEARPHFYNAIQVVGDDGTILSSYDKVHLVPFGEYLPLSGLLQSLGLRQFVHVPGGFEPGTARSMLQVRGLPAVAPLICYEAIFPGAVVPAGPRPGLLLNVTNDAWFGLTPGPYQHFAQSRLRAIEEGLPLVRAANTGISAVVDPYGRLVASLPLGAEGVLDAQLPMTIMATTYARFGDIPFAGFILGCMIMMLAVRLTSRRA